MATSPGTDWLAVLDGQDRSPRARLLRGALGVAGRAYAGVMALRNWKYARGWGVRRAARPVISVGNLTTGGTGKTPVVKWLCEQLVNAGERPAVLTRGYKAEPGAKGDEQLMLEELLAGGRDRAWPTPVWANRDRLAGAAEVLARFPETSCFVLDDGFQHRRLARDFDLVLIDATNPWGFGRVLPGGLLRERVAGIARADAVLITRADQVADPDVARILERVRRHNAAAPVYRATHSLSVVRRPEGEVGLGYLDGRRVLVAAGIGNPDVFARQIEGLGSTVAGRRFFPDHHAFTNADVDSLMHEAATAGAEAVVMTDKDWVKVGRVVRDEMGGVTPLPVWRVGVEIRFLGEGEEADLVDRITMSINKGALRLVAGRTPGTPDAGT